MLPNSVEFKLNEGLQLRRMPVAEFAVVAKLDGIEGASKSKLFEAFRDDKPMLNATAQELSRLWQEIVAMCDAIKPFELDLSDGQKVYNWLVQHRAGALKIIVAHDAPAVDAFRVFYGGGVFAGRLKPSNDEGAAVVMTRRVANQIIDKLTSIGYDGVKARQYNGDAEVVSDVTKVWR